MPVVTSIVRSRLCKVPLASFAVAMSLWCQRPAAAASYTEAGDAGDLPATAQVISASTNTSLTAINGTLSVNSATGLSEADLYEIRINNPAGFSATTTNFVAGRNSFDSQLFLFQLNGKGIVANDDDSNSGGQQSTIPAGNALTSSLPAGNYYLLITGSSMFPADSTGKVIFPNFTDGTTDPSGVYGPTGPGGNNAIAKYSGSSNEGGNYSIALTGAQFIAVPEPSVGIGAAALGIIALGRRAPRRRVMR